MKSFIFFSFIVLAMCFSCKKEEPSPLSKVIGDWESEKKISWLTITGPVPGAYLFIPEKDTSIFFGERLSFRSDGKVYLERPDSRANSFFRFTISPYINNKNTRDTVNYTFTDNQLKFEKKQFFQTFDVTELTANSLIIHQKLVFPEFTKEDWIFYHK